MSSVERALMHYGLLRVRVDPDGRLIPLWYSVGNEHDFNQATVVNGEYTIIFCVLPLARTVEEARRHLKLDLPWFAPLLQGATPEAWFSAEDDDSHA